MTCERCFHYKVCEGHLILNDIPMELCGLFKDKSHIVELPCNVGDTVYEIMFGPVREIYFIEETTITAFHIKNNEILVDLGICRMTLNVRDFNRWFFTDKSKAEAKLKELNNER